MIRLRTLGTLDLLDDDGTSIGSVLAQPKRFALLTYLVLAEPGHFQRRDTLLGLFWPMLDTTRGRAALSQALYYLRRSLGPQIVVSRGQEEVGVDLSHLWCDAVALEEALSGRADDAVAGGLDLYRGDLLPGFFLAETPEFESWLETERSRLRGRVAEAARTLSKHTESSGSTSGAIHWESWALRVAGYDDSTLRRLLDLLDRSGDRAGAVRVYEEAAERLARQYDLEPSPETQQRMAEIRDRFVASESAPRARFVPDEEAPLLASPAPGQAESEPTPRRWPVPAAAAQGGERPVRRFKVWLGPLAAAALILITAHLWPQRSGDDLSGVSEPPRPSHRVAILPMAHLGADENDGYIADGLTVELITRFARLRDLQVTPFTAVRAYRGSERTVTEIGRELQVATIVEGDARKVGEAVRVTVRLIDVETEAVLWSGRYDGRLSDLLGVQDKIAEEVARALKLERRAEDDRLRGGRVVSAEAYEEYVRGRSLLNRLDGPSLLAARDHFLDALEHERDFAEAWSGLANALNQLTATGLLSGPEVWERAREAAREALARDDELAEAHAALATVHSIYDWNGPGAERHFRRSIELDPSYSEAFREYAIHLRSRGRFNEALDQVRRAQDLDPGSAPAVLEEASILYVSGRIEEGIAVVRRLLSDMETGPGPGPTTIDAPDAPSFRPQFLLALLLVEKKDFDRALATLDAADPSHRRPDAGALRAYLLAEMGREADARVILRELDTGGSIPSASPFHTALIRVALGENERALDMLESAVEERSRLVRLLAVEPKYDPIRDQPRFRALLQRLGLPDLTSAPPTAVPAR